MLLIIVPKNQLRTISTANIRRKNGTAKQLPEYFQKTLIFSILGVITPLNMHGRSYRECYNFQIQFGFFMTWTDERGMQQIFRFEHKCHECGAELVRLTGTSKQTAKLKCPKCGGGIEVDNSSVINVVSRY